jgi:hypothetical protein
VSNKRLLTTAIMIMIFISLPACASANESAHEYGKFLPTSIPEYVQTDQASAIDARSTIAVAEAESSIYSGTATARAVEAGMRATMIALDLVAAYATETAIAQRTRDAKHASATVFAAHLTETQAVSNSQATAAAGNLTQTAGAQNAIMTATAGEHAALQTVHSGSVTATADERAASVQSTEMQYQMNVLERQDRAEEALLWFKTWAWRVLILLLIAGCIVIIIRMLPWAMSRMAISVQRLGKDGNRIVAIMQLKDGGAVVLDPHRQLTPGMTIRPDGQLLPGGGAVVETVQERVTARSQAAELVAASGGKNDRTARRIARSANNASQSPPASDNIIDATFRTVGVNDPEVSTWMEEIRPKLLED